MRVFPLLFLAACAPDIAAVMADGVPATPSFSADVAPILEQHCVRCHERDGTLDGGVELDTYLGARGARVSSTCTSVGDDVVDVYSADLLPEAGNGSDVPCEPWKTLSMPPGAEVKLSIVEQVMLAQWVATGAQP